MTTIHNLIFDPIPFKGGSKIATSEALSLCNSQQVTFTVLTVDDTFWLSSRLVRQRNANVVSLTSIPWISQQYSGLFYWVNQFYFALLLFFHLLRLPKVNQVVGASGPGIDMAIYLAQFVFRFSILQLIHGDVAPSRSIGWCLTRAEQVFYLPSARQSICKALELYIQHRARIADARSVALYYLDSNHFQSFVNGIHEENWPSRSKIDFPVCFWCASLLKWKGLDLFVETLRHTQLTHRIVSHICFIQPTDTTLDVSSAPVALKTTQWYQDPANLDDIRSQCNIFVSTSHQEPFGLSILEALAAGMCVIIPHDGSYWDLKLTHDVNCVKYQANDHLALSQAILSVYRNRDRLKSIQTHALQLAHGYKAQETYAALVACASGQQRLSALAANIDATKTEAKKNIELDYE